jgi:hypothetical protein
MATPPDFTAGQVLNAAQMNAVGLWLVKSQTIGSAVSSVSVTGAFNADYTNYLIQIAGGVGSTNAELRLTFDAGTPTNNYFHGGVVFVYGGASAPFEAANGVTTGIRIGESQTTGYGVEVKVFTPFLSTTTTSTNSVCSGRTISSTRGGFYNQSVSNTGFTVTPSTGTITGGVIYVYGYRD